MNEFEFEFEFEFFNPGQLSLIRSVAAECEREYESEGGGELAVWDLVSSYTHGWEPEQLAVIEFCARECDRQESGAFSVYLMCWAWDCATVSRSRGVVLTGDLIDELAVMIEPTKNGSGNRRQVVTARGGIVIGSHPDHIDSDMRELSLMLEAYQTEGLREHWGRPVTPQSLYERFETIHPRVDGNGRLGKIIFNWLSGTMTDPVMPELPAGFFKV